MPGLAWLSEPRYENVPLCLTFVRGVGEHAVFAAFGADPGEVVPVSRRGSVSRAGDAPVVRVGGSGEWLVAIEENIPPQGVRLEVLRRVSAGAEVVSIYQDIGKDNHQFAHAVDGEIVSAVVTAVPPHWYGSDPEPIAARARELGMDSDSGAAGDLTDWQVLLTLAEKAFGLSLDEEDLDQPWPAAQVLPVLEDLPHAPPGKLGIGDPVVDLLLAHAAGQTLQSVTSLRIGRLLAESGLGEYRELTAAAQRILAQGEQQQVHDHDPAGLTLRRLARDQGQAEGDLAVGRDRPGFSDAEARERIRRGKVAWVLRLALAGRHGQALVNDLRLQRTWHPATWREQALDDLASVQVPAAEMEVAERAWQVTRHLPDPVGMTDTGPVRQHVQRLLDSGMDRSRIAELAGMTAVGLDRILSGRIPQISGYRARQLLVIEPP